MPHITPFSRTWYKYEIVGLPWCIMVQFPQESPPINCIILRINIKSSKTYSYCMLVLVCICTVCCRNAVFHLPRTSHCSASTFYSPLPVPWPGRSHNDTLFPRLVKGYRVGCMVPSPSAEITGIWSSGSSIWKCCKIARISELLPGRLGERSNFNHGKWMIIEWQWVAMSIGEVWNQV